MGGAVAVAHYNRYRHKSSSYDMCAACFLLQQLLFALLSVVEVDILLLVAGMDHPSSIVWIIHMAMDWFLDVVQGDNTKAGPKAWNGSKGMLGTEPSGFVEILILGAPIDWDVLR